MITSAVSCSPADLCCLWTVLALFAHGMDGDKRLSLWAGDRDGGCLGQRLRTLDVGLVDDPP